MPSQSNKRVCVFVDGENFRYSLTALFADNRYEFSKSDYLPNADWKQFFGHLLDDQPWELIRVYWYVTRDIDIWPSNVPFAWDDKRQFIKKHKIDDKLRSQGVKDVDLERPGLKAAESTLDRRKKAILSRHDGWSKVQVAIERNNDQLEFRRFGSISFNLVNNRFGREKGVDTQLATDLVTLADIYDVALIVSGDADYIPPVTAVKNLGKLVYSVSFLNQDGEKLPGGAKRLERRVDGRIELEFDNVRELLDIGDAKKEGAKT